MTCFALNVSLCPLLVVVLNPATTILFWSCEGVFRARLAMSVSSDKFQALAYVLSVRVEHIDRSSPKLRFKISFVSPPDDRPSASAKSGDNVTRSQLA